MNSFEKLCSKALTSTISLDMRSCRNKDGKTITIDELTKLVEILNRNPDIWILNMDNDNLKDEHAIVLSGLKHITSLCITRNSVYEKGYEALFKSSIKNIKFGCQCTREGARSLPDKGIYAKVEPLSEQTALDQSSSRPKAERLFAETPLDEKHSCCLF